MQSHWHAKFLSCLLGGIILPLSAASAHQAPGSTAGDVYVLTNQPSGNGVMVYHRLPSGKLTPRVVYPTGGNGAGSGSDPLQSQNPLILNETGKVLLAVNAGSDSVTAFKASGDMLTLANTVSSGGTMPVSVTVRGNLVYVLNAGGGVPNISGFSLNVSTGMLTPLADSTQPVPGGSGSAPAEVAFVPGEQALLVTEKTTSQIDTFAVNGDGLAQPGTTFHSRRPTPFGFGFANDIAIVSDAVNGKANSAALSSYKIRDGRNPKVISAAVPDTQTAACWVAVTDDGAYAYAVNTASGTISSYGVSVGGQLTLLDASAGGGNIPVDAALSTGSQFFYVRNGGDGTVEGFVVKSDGSLASLTMAGGLPDGAAGLAAR
jgi:6-phosphogluconolactonase